MSLNPFCSRFTCMFRVIVLLRRPASSELQPADRHLDVIPLNTLINLGIHFFLHSIKRCFSVGMMSSCWFVVPFLQQAHRCKQFSLGFIIPHSHTRMKKGVLIYTVKNEDGVFQSCGYKPEAEIKPQCKNTWLITGFSIKYT